MIFFKKLPSATCRLVFNRGFTVMELLVVMAIMGVLYTVVMSSVGDSRSKGRDSKRIADISLIQLALERYYDEKHIYPNDLSSSNLENMSENFSNNNDYKYACLNNCQSYHLGVSLENDNSVLEDDEDSTNGFNGGDGQDCNGESGGYCYDVIPKF